MSVGSVGGSNSGSGVDGANNSLGGESAQDLQTTFLKLLITQLQNQDPTNPMDSSQMTSQLAQISTVSGISNLNSSLASLQAQINASQQLEAGALVGKGVLAAGNQIALVDSKDSSGNDTHVASPAGVQLPQDADDVVVTVKDSKGNVVDTIDLGKQSKGVVAFQWDGKDSSGNQAADGTYSFSVKATSGTGSSASSVDATALSYWLVDGVGAASDGSTNFNLTQGSSAETVPYSDIAEIL